MKKILIICTGGTLMAKEALSGLTPVLKGKDISGEILKAAANSADSTDLSIETEDFLSVDSSNIFPSDWGRLAARIETAAKDFDGVVLIQGTDTLAYTASMLSFMLKGIPIPVVFTGSQIPISSFGSDAKDNLRSAILMAKSGIGGVFVAFSGRIILGCRAKKVRSKSFNAFESINFPYLGEVAESGLRLNSDLFHEIRIDGSEFSKDPKGLKEPCSFKANLKFSEKVFLLKLYPGISPDIFDILIERGYRGVYIEGFGVGNMPNIALDGSKSFTEALKKATDKGLIVLAGTQCAYEGADLSIYETGKDALLAGAIDAKDMTTEAAVTKLMWALGQSDDKDTVRKILSS